MVGICQHILMTLCPIMTKKMKKIKRERERENHSVVHAVLTLIQKWKRRYTLKELLMATQFLWMIKKTNNFLCQQKFALGHMCALASFAV